jgi:hypothetical protein
VVVGWAQTLGGGDGEEGRGRGREGDGGGVWDKKKNLTRPRFRSLICLFAAFWRLHEGSLPPDLAQAAETPEARPSTPENTNNIRPTLAVPFFSEMSGKKYLDCIFKSIILYASPYVVKNI